MHGSFKVSISSCCRVFDSIYIVCLLIPYQMMFVSLNNNTTSINSGTDTLYSTGAREFTSVINGD